MGRDRRVALAGIQGGGKGLEVDLQEVTRTEPAIRTHWTMIQHRVE
jgi:hypothetical protein